MSGTVDDMVRSMEKLIGLGEPNFVQEWYRQKQGSAYAGNFPWCNAAVSWAAWDSGCQEAVTFGGYYAYTVAHAEAFRQHGRWHSDVAGIQRGDVVFMDWGHTDTIANIDHVELVTGVSGNVVSTIGGNYQNRCDRWTRTATDIAGYGRPAYASAPVPPSYEPFPGALFFINGRRSPVIARMHDRLVAEGCGRYQSSSNKDVWGSGDKASYAAWQRKLGFTGSDADGVPGATSWNRLKVPRS